jgi:hypothetical protein
VLVHQAHDHDEKVSTRMSVDDVETKLKTGLRRYAAEILRWYYAGADEMQRYLRAAEAASRAVIGRVVLP